MTSKWLAWGASALVSSLVGCQRAPETEPRTAARTTVHAVESSQTKSTSPDDNCGLDDFPVSKSTKEILAAVPHDGTRSPNSMMQAKVAIDPEGRLTHLRVLRLAYPELPNSDAINQQAVDSIKRWRHAPTMLSGKPVAVCSDVSVTIDLGSE